MVLDTHTGFMYLCLSSTCFIYTIYRIAIYNLLLFRTAINVKNLVSVVTILPVDEIKSVSHLITT